MNVNKILGVISVIPLRTKLLLAGTGAGVVTAGAGHKLENERVIDFGADLAVGFLEILFQEYKLI